MLARYLALICLVAVGGCAIDPAPNSICEIPFKVLDTSEPSNSGQESPLRAIQDTFDAELDRMLETAPERTADQPAKYLFLSGGSQKGAFGAGFLKGWSERHNGRLPEFEVVTGVSTGAIMSTAAFIGDGHNAFEKFGNLSSETKVITPYASKTKDGKFTKWSYIVLAQKGAAADLKPMRQQVIDYLSNTVNIPGDSSEISKLTVIERVAKQPTNRALYVGAVDVDSGKAVAFNLTEFVRRNGTSPYVVECYADAIVASASVPAAAPPTFINNRMYVDGGARFAVFNMAIANALQRRAERIRRGFASSAEAPNLYLIINGIMQTQPHCEPFEDAKIGSGTEFCGQKVGEPGGLIEKRPKWSLDDLAMRSVDILIVQVTRFSVETIRLANLAAFPHEKGSNLRFAKIDSAKSDVFLFERDGRKQSCQMWYDEEKRTKKPLEFFPVYMACLAAYGRQAALNSDW